MRVRSRFIILLAGCTVLGGCFSPQKPAPVTLYGRTAGAGSAGVHTVIAGEKLYDIAKRYNIVMRDIVVTNDLAAPFVLSAGQRLKLPPPQEYVVRRGDTIYQVSRLFAVESTEVARMNALSAPYALEAGQVLRLPSVTGKTSPYNVQTAAYMPAVPPASVISAEVLAPPEVAGPVALDASMATADAGSGALDGPPPPKPDAPAQEAASFETASIAPAEEVQSKPKPKVKVSAPTPPRSSSKFLMPVEGRIISGYGSKNNGLHNDGINIAASKGTPVKAAENGVVVYAGNELKGTGNLVLIRHADRWMTAYAHMDGIKVERGDTIKRGQVIGTVGSTGSVDSPQLHFEVRRGTEAINPKVYIEG